MVLNKFNNIDVRLFIIHEPIHTYDPVALNLWQKALWAKEQGYRQEYNSNILPVGEDDFIATHLIAAEVIGGQQLEPMFMYKSITQEQCKRFEIPFPLHKLLKGTEHENSLIVQKLLNETKQISYDSSWSINPEYKKRGREFCQWLRDLTTVLGCSYHRTFGPPRWVTCGVTKFKIDKYFESVGGEEVLPEFQLDIIDGETVRMIYIKDADPPANCMKLMEEYSQLWKDLTVFSPNYMDSQKNQAA